MPLVEAAAQSAPAKQHTEHDGANEAIESLRGVAATVKELGDGLLESEGVRADLQEQVAELENEASQRASEAERLLGDWQDTLDRFRLGLCDKDELLKLTVGT